LKLKKSLVFIQYLSLVRSGLSPLPLSFGQSMKKLNYDERNEKIILHRIIYMIIILLTVKDFFPSPSFFTYEQATTQEWSGENTLLFSMSASSQLE
jgi:hypothetical protein